LLGFFYLSDRPMLVVGLFIGNILEVAAHVVRVTETAHWLEWQDWADPVLQKPYEIRDGLLHIPDVLGVGLEWNEEAVAASRANL
jgi:mandelate racemase